MNKKQKKKLYRIIIAAVLFVILSRFEFENGWVALVLYLIPYLVVGYDVLIEAFHGILNKQIFDENFLMSFATIGALCLQDYQEALAVMLFNQIGQLFESYAVNKSRKNIGELMDMRPDYANMEVDGQIIKIDPQEVHVGSIIVVSPGEKIPLDGIVIEGKGTINTASLTGESNPVLVKADDEIYSGCICNDTVLRIKTTKEYDQSTASKILELISNASSAKSKSENFISKFAHIYTPVVVFSAVILAIVPPIVNYFITGNLEFATWIYRALSFLVISCPCALVISIPLCFFLGIGGASKCGILVKGSNYLETLAKVKCVVFDKTGTITKGILEINDVHHNSIDRDTLIEYAAYSESYSSHPIASCIISQYGKEIDKTRIKEVNETPGEGIRAIIDDKVVLVGSSELMKKNNIDYIDCHSTGTICHVAIDGKYCGHLVISDIIKPNARSCMLDLKNNGIDSIIMLTGDNELVAQDIVRKVKIDRYHSKLLPQNKLEKLEEILDEYGQKKKVAFVGDGINDAPAIGRADVGIAMGALGADAAIEAADIVLMDDDLAKVSKSIRISKKCMRIVNENLWFSIIVKLACIVLGALGITYMWLDVFADVGVMIIAVANSIRALFVQKA